jgi:hypothetical protein
MPTLTVYVAPAGPQQPGHFSIPGHTWYEIQDGSGGQPSSYGWAPATPGALIGEGAVQRNDTANYAPTWSRTIDITEAQYQLLSQFGTIPQLFEFNSGYNAFSNSCVDFVWAALNLINPGQTGYEGTLFPNTVLNRSELAGAL